MCGATYDIGSRLAKSLAKVTGSEGYREEVKGIPALQRTLSALPYSHTLATACPGIESATHPGEEGNSEESPLGAVEHHDQLDRIWCIVHWRLEAAQAAPQIRAGRHAVMRWVLGFLPVGDGPLDGSRIGCSLLAIGHGEVVVILTKWTRL